MDRQIVYPGQILPETTLLQMSKDAMMGLSKLSAAVLGCNTLINGFAVTPCAPASLQLNVAPGEIYSLQNVDATAFSTLAADTTHQIVKQGLLLDPVQLALIAPAQVGQSVNVLVQVGYQDSDVNGTLLPYYNSANPLQQFAGQSNNGQTQSTARKGLAVVQAKAGIAAATGSQVTPAPDSGYVGVAVVTLAYGQTQITAANISVYPGAPFIGETLAQKAGQLAFQQDLYTAATAGGTADALTATFTPAFTATTLAAGCPTVTVRATSANATTTPTFTPAPGVIAPSVIVKGNGQPMAAGDIAGAGHWITLQWDATLAKWVLLNPAMGVSPVLSSSFRNLLVNGAMRVAQQYGNAAQNAVSGSGQGTWVVDQWIYGSSQPGKFNFQQVSGPAAQGFDAYAKFTVASAYAVGSSDFFAFYQNIEAQNLASLAWGTPNAKPVSLQFVVNSSVTGTFSGSLRNGASTRSYPFTFTISQANTDTLVTVPNIPGDTSGSWSFTGTSSGLTVLFDLGSGAAYRAVPGAWGSGSFIGATGAVSLVATAGATFSVTGVQLEAGPICTPFERPTAEAELLRCQRYLPFFAGLSTSYPLAAGMAINVTQAVINVPFKVQTRVAPTGMVVTSPTGMSVCNNIGTAITATSTGFNAATTYAGLLVINVSSGLTAGNATLAGMSAGTSVFFTGAQL